MIADILNNLKTETLLSDSDYIMEYTNILEDVAEVEDLNNKLVQK